MNAHRIITKRAFTVRRLTACTLAARTLAGRPLTIAAIALAALIPVGCASDPATSGAASKPADSGAVTRSALSGFSIGGINLGSAVGVAQSASDALGDVSEPQEIDMGKSIAAGLLGAAPLDRNVAQQRYVNSVGRWIALNSGRPDLPWHFGIIDAETVNAFATPGGNIFVSRGLLARMHGESELAGVLAHEISHVVLKHHLADIRKHGTKELVLNVAQLKGGGGLAGEAARAVGRVGLEGFVRGLSREDELEADALGVVIAARSGYEPYGLVAVLQTLQAMPADDSALGQFLHTHPSPADRIAVLEKKMPPSFDALAKPNPALARFNQTVRPAH